MEQNDNLEIKDDELKRRALELAESENRRPRFFSRKRIILLIFMALCLVYILIACHQMGAGLDTTI